MVPREPGASFPFGTLVVNVIGRCGARLAGRPRLRPGIALLLAGTASLGSYTTFSTWMLETQRLVEEGELVCRRATCWSASAVGLGAAALGRLHRRPPVNEDCLKLTTYFGERQRTEDDFVADALLDLYGRQEVEISVLLRGAEGFGLKHHLRAPTGC